MKLSSIAIFVSSLLVLHTATAYTPGASLRFIRRSLENNYRIRDTVPDSENEKAVNPTDAGNVDGEPEAIGQGSDPQRLLGNPRRENSLAPEEISPGANEVAHDDASVYDSNDPAGSGTFPKRKGDSPPYTGSEFPENPEPANSLSRSPSFRRFKMYGTLISIFANIYRIPQTVALQIESVISGVQKTYPPNTDVGAYMTGTRLLLKNSRALKLYDLLDRAGVPRLPDLISSMPSVFLPVFNAVDRFYEMIVQRGIALSQRLAGAVRRATEKATRSLGGINFARGTDSYSLSVPNLIDMVLKGRLASSLDELFAYVQRGIGSSLYSVGSVFGGGNPTSNPTSEMSDPAPEDEPIRNQPAYRMRSNPRFSGSRNYRPSRYLY